MIILLLVILLLGPTSLVVGQNWDIRDRFKVDFSESRHGNCKWVGENLLNKLYEDAVQLAEHGTLLVEEFEEEYIYPARRLMHSFFLAPGEDDDITDDDLETIKNIYAGVTNFLTQNGPYNLPNEKNDAPYLFCDSHGLELRGWDDDWYDSSGSEEFDDELDRYVKLTDVPQLLKAKEEVESKHGGEAIALWFAAAGEYLVLQENFDWECGLISPGGDGENAAFILPLEGILVLCPRMWGVKWADYDPANPPMLVESRDYIPLLGPEAQPHPHTELDDRIRNDKNSLQPLSEVFPTAGTLFHELIHLVHGEKDTTPEEGEIYDVLECINADTEDALRNAETYTLLSCAFLYTNNVFFDAGPVEFYSGYALVVVEEPEED